MHKIYSVLFTSLLSTVLLGCASSPDIEYVEIPQFNTVAIVKATDLPSLEKLRDSSERAAEAAGVGAASGGVAGLATGVLLCGTTGPLAGLCISGLGMAGLLTGGAGGLIYGVVTGAEGKHAESINSNLEDVGVKYDLQQETLDRLIQQVPKELVQGIEQADIVVSPILSSIHVEQPDKDRMYLRLTGNLVFSWTQNGGDEFFGKAEFDYKSPTATLDEWNRDHHKMYEDAVLNGLDDLTGKMNQRILYRINLGPQNLQIKPAADAQ